MFENWDTTTNTQGRPVYQQGDLLAAKVEGAPFTEEEGSRMSELIIYAAGETFGSDFYASWNGVAEVRLYREEERGILVVMSMAYEDDEDDIDGGMQDNPTFAWKKDGDDWWLVASKEWRDTTPAEALGIEWPAKDQFVHLSDLQGWGE